MKYQFVIKESFLFLFLTSLVIVFPARLFAQNVACPVDAKTLQFVGKPVDQAKCLLRPNTPRGILLSQLGKLPRPLAKLIGRAVKIRKDSFRKYLQKNGVSENDLGGSLDEALSSAKLPNGNTISALYFIIHDTSTPNYKTSAFPFDIDDKAWKYNDLTGWVNNPVAHIFVNRMGESITTTPFSQTVKKGWGTKFARDILKVDAKGLEIHIELCQPRRSSPEWFEGNDEIAPEPGFTNGQYQRLALLYVAAGIRRGSWLIPAYHSAVDAGIRDAHDDPQHFELASFAKEIDKILKSI